MRKIAVIIAVVVAAFTATTVPSYAGQAGRDNTRNVLIGGVLLCQFVDCRQAVSNIFGGRDGGGNWDGYSASAGEQAAFRQGQADALAELQAIREQNAYNLGRGSVGGGRIFGSFGGRCYGC